MSFWENLEYKLFKIASDEEQDRIQRLILPHYGIITGKPQSIKKYPLDHLTIDQIQDFTKQHGYTPKLFGGQIGPPDFKNHNYDTGHLMIYSPYEDHGSFHDPEYTHKWRMLHELGHALTLPAVNGIYGEGRRAGKLGAPLSLTEAKRAIHWEDMVSDKQRELSKQLGSKIDDGTHAHEKNINLGDAVVRALSGNFSDPHSMGFVPYDVPVPLEKTLSLVDDYAKNIGKERQPNKVASLFNNYGEKICCPHHHLWWDK